MGTMTATGGITTIITTKTGVRTGMSTMPTGMTTGQTTGKTTGSTVIMTTTTCTLMMATAQDSPQETAPSGTLGTLLPSTSSLAKLKMQPPARCATLTTTPNGTSCLRPAWICDQ